VAETVATLDQISGGRVDFGSARGISRSEPEGFRVDPHTTRDEWRESLEMIVRAWEDGEFSWKRERFDIPPCSVVPKPVQDPHPPLWMACTSVDTHRLAGELGLGLLSFTVMAPLEDLRVRMDAYRDGLSRAQPIGKRANPQAATYTQIHCADTDEQAQENARAGIEW
jgi:alkanesulfonate monooxygenase SsuD/methylene tetrahydromethanopterin reductase-like flavin-dependent oxidoreductase (luciferase family)